MLVQYGDNCCCSSKIVEVNYKIIDNHKIPQQLARSAYSSDDGASFVSPRWISDHHFPLTGPQ